jgi:hypothetical protein
MEVKGHIFEKPVNNMATLMAAEKFFAQYLGGQYQPGGTPETVKRLSDISVDASSLK